MQGARQIRHPQREVALKLQLDRMTRLNPAIVHDSAIYVGSEIEVGDHFTVDPA